MKKQLFLLLMCFFSVLLYSCKKDLDIIGDWKETMVVYGLLNPADSNQYIRINKAFLGEGDALKMAQVSDSINYSNVLNVVIERWKNGGKLQSYILERDSTSIAKDPGLFSNEKNILYKLSYPDIILQDGSEYKLTVTNTQTGHAATSQTVIVGNISLPLQSSKLNLVNLFKAKWTSATNGKVYNFTFRFHYQEISNTTFDTTYRYVDWVFPNQLSLTTDGGEAMQTEIPQEDFFRFIANHINPDASVYRIPKESELIYTAGTIDLNTYIEANKPSSGIVQDKPDYTNISEGVGLFSSRYTKAAKIDSLNNATWDSLACGRYTEQLNFRRQDGSACP